MPEPDGHIPIPILEGDWPAQAATSIEQLVTTVRDKTTVPALTAARAVVYAIVGGSLLLVAFVLFTICFIRLVDNYLPGDVWAAYVLVGSVFLLAGLILWTQRGRASIQPAPAPTTLSPV
ncbi:MAG TPA: phage holin family protein [Acidimicrobiales bacterium]|nr:phage holin family protein [Acidimicrobiales bacterium]